MARQIRDVMTDHPSTLTSDATLETAAREMRDRDIGSVIVLDGNGGSICGIVTDRDIVVRGIAVGKDPAQAKLSEICSREPATLSPDQSIEDAVRLMREKAVRRLPVQERGRPIGVVSLGDLALERDEKSVLGQISASPANR
jgi:CBS domain-containing protein